MGCFHSDTKPKASGIYGFAKQQDMGEAVKFALNKGEDEDISTQMDLHISCKNLKNVDIGSLTDSVCVVYIKDSKTCSYLKVGQTEVITDNLDPEFVQSILVDYYFEQTQEMKIVVFDVDDFSPSVPVEQNFLGEVFFKLAQVASAYAGLTLELKGEKNEKVGEIILQGSERKKGTHSVYFLEFEAQNFPYLYTFYRLAKKLPNGQFAPIYESETANRTSAGCHIFKTAEIHSAALISDDEAQPAQIEFFEWNYKGQHRSVGKQEFIITQMIEMIPMNFKGGKFLVRRCEKQERHSFLDYVQGGLEIALTIGVDFTLSNKDPSNPESLHFFDLALLQCYKVYSKDFSSFHDLQHDIIIQNHREGRTFVRNCGKGFMESFTNTKVHECDLIDNSLDYFTNSMENIFYIQSGEEKIGQLQ